MQKTVKKAQKGFTLIELLIVIAVIAILAAIAIPNLISSRKAANESSAISSLRTISTAQETYRSKNNTYGSLAELGTAKILDPVLGKANASKSGYKFASGNSDSGTYSVTAEPVNTGTGDRYFFMDQTGVIRSANGATANGNSPSIDETPSTPADPEP